MSDYKSGLYLIPEHCREGVINYLERGIPTGSFLTAIFSNNLVESYLRADNINIEHIKDYVNFLYNYAPSYPFRSWGSKETVQAWIKSGGLSSWFTTQKKEQKEGAN